MEGEGLQVWGLGGLYPRSLRSMFLGFWGSERDLHPTLAEESLALFVGFGVQVFFFLFSGGSGTLDPSPFTSDPEP